MIRPWFRHAAVPWKTTATQTRASGENRVSTKPGVLQSAVAAIGAAFTAAAGLPGWAVLGQWRFACAVTGGSLLAANASSPFLVIGRRRFMPPGSS